MMMTMTLNFKIKKQTNKQTNLFWDLAVYQDLSFVPQLSSVEIAIVQFAYYVERKLFGMHLWRYSLSLFLIGTQIKDLSPTLQNNVTNQD